MKMNGQTKAETEGLSSSHSANDGEDGSASSYLYTPAKHVELKNC